MKMLLPVDLSPFYPYPKNISLFSLEYFIPICLAVAVTAACIAVMRNRKLWLAVWGYYGVTLMPVIGIVQVGAQSMADRYTYLPSLGPFLIIGLIAATTYEKLSASDRWRVMVRMAGFGIAVILLISLSYATIRQIGIWKNNIVFWKYIAEKSPLFPDVHNSLACAYSDEGQLDNAIEQYRTAISLKPDYLEAYNNLANAYSSKGQFDMAIQQYRAAVNLNPELPVVRFNFGNAYLSTGQFDRAIEQYRAALRLKPDFAVVHLNLGLSYLNTGLQDMARKEFELALANDPGDLKARQALNSIGSK
jgi:tetratricopeptide (TPR) repeat protein